MYDICHPTYYHMSQLGCNDQVKLTTSFYVFMELCEVKRYWDVNYKYCQELELFFLEARKTKTSPVDLFVPWPAFNNITLDLISNIQQALAKEKFTFVFKDGDTTSVYYSISSGLIKPISPEETKCLKQKEDKKYDLDKEICRNAANLYERALIFDNDCNNKCSPASNNIVINNIIKTDDSNLNKESSDIKISNHVKSESNSNKEEYFESSEINNFEKTMC